MQKFKISLFRHFTSSFLFDLPPKRTFLVTESSSSHPNREPKRIKDLINNNLNNTKYDKRNYLRTDE